MVPALTPVTLPDPSVVAVPVLLLLQVPPPVTSLNDTVAPVHSAIAPCTGAGFAFTVTLLTAIQPVGALYVIFTVPAATAVTIPVLLPTVAVNMLLLLHTPLPVSERVVVVPAHNTKLPVAVCGLALTITVAAVVQPGPTL